MADLSIKRRGATKSVTAIFAENLTRALEFRDMSGNNAAVSRAAKLHGHEITPQHVGRLKEGEYSPRAESVEALASALGYEAWQLLVPGFDPSDPPVILSGQERSVLRTLLGRGKAQD